MSGYLEPGGYLKLDEAARRLGCHVETLRLRVRNGELAARRGPHGAYYVTDRALKEMRPLVRHPPPRTFSEEELVGTWEVVRAQVAASFRSSLGEQALLAELQQDPLRYRSLYRLISVHRLQLTGLSFEEIALHLGISSRHARRLGARTSVAWELRYESWRRRQPPRMTWAEAGPIIDDLRRRLEASGFRGHQGSHRRSHWDWSQAAASGRRMPAWKIRYPNKDELAQLRRIGITDAQLMAIRIVGIGNDELHELLNRTDLNPSEDPEGTPNLTIPKQSPGDP